MAAGAAAVDSLDSHQLIVADPDSLPSVVVGTVPVVVDNRLAAAGSRLAVVGSRLVAAGNL